MVVYLFIYLFARVTVSHTLFLIHYNGKILFCKADISIFSLSYSYKHFISVCLPTFFQDTFVYQDSSEFCLLIYSSSLVKGTSANTTLKDYWLYYFWYFFFFTFNLCFDFAGTLHVFTCILYVNEGEIISAKVDQDFWCNAFCAG